MAKYFIVNVGSESRKYALYQDGERVFFAHFEKENGKLIENSTEYVIGQLLEQKLIGALSEISAIGFRVVAPGSYFLQNKIIDGEYLQKLEAAKEQAPLHINPMLAEIKTLQQILPGIPVIGVSDSAFHGSLPVRARFYGIPKNTAEETEKYL
jgi:acetate kinase